MCSCVCAFVRVCVCITYMCACMFVGSAWGCACERLCLCACLQEGLYHIAFISVVTCKRMTKDTVTLTTIWQLILDGYNKPTLWWRRLFLACFLASVRSVQQGNRRWQTLARYDAHVWCHNACFHCSAHLTSWGTRTHTHTHTHTHLGYLAVKCGNLKTWDISTHTLNSFKSHLKTHYFKLAYNLWLYTYWTSYIFFIFYISDLYVFIYF